MRLTNLSIQYAAGDSIYVAGTRESLRRLIEMMNSGEETSIDLDLPEESGTKAVGIGRIQIRPASGKASFAIEGDSLVIQGSAEMRNLASLSIKYLCEPPQPGRFESEHTHLEAFNDHPFLDDASWPMIVSVHSV